MIALTDRDLHPACGSGAPRSAREAVPVEAALCWLIDHFEQGIAVTDRSGRPFFLNGAAQALIRRDLLRLRNGCLCSATPEHGAALGRDGTAFRDGPDPAEIATGSVDHRAAREAADPPAIRSLAGR